MYLNEKTNWIFKPNICEDSNKRKEAGIFNWIEYIILQIFKRELRKKYFVNFWLNQPKFINKIFT